MVDLGYNYRIDEISRRAWAWRSSQNWSRTTSGGVTSRNSTGRPWRIWRPWSSFPLYTPRYILRPHHARAPAEGANRLNFMESMKSQGIQTSVHYPPIHTFTAYAGHRARNPLPCTDDVAAREVTLPLYPGLSDHDVTTVVEAVATALKEFLRSIAAPWPTLGPGAVQKCSFWPINRVNQERKNRWRSETSYGCCVAGCDY